MTATDIAPAETNSSARSIELAELREHLRFHAKSMSLMAKTLRKEELRFNTKSNSLFKSLNQLNYLFKKEKELAGDKKNDVPLDVEVKLKRVLKKLEKSKRKASHAYSFRVNVMRPEARSVHLLRGYLAGTPYKTVENNVRADKAEREPAIDCVMIAATNLHLDAEELEAIKKWIEA